MHHQVFPQDQRLGECSPITGERAFPWYGRVYSVCYCPDLLYTKWVLNFWRSSLSRKLLIFAYIILSQQIWLLLSLCHHWSTEAWVWSRKLKDNSRNQKAEKRNKKEGSLQTPTLWICPNSSNCTVAGTVFLFTNPTLIKLFRKKKKRLWNISKILGYFRNESWLNIMIGLLKQKDHPFCPK